MRKVFQQNVSTRGDFYGSVSLLVHSSRVVQWQETVLLNGKLNDKIAMYISKCIDLFLLPNTINDEIEESDFAQYVPATPPVDDIDKCFACVFLC